MASQRIVNNYTGQGNYDASVVPLLVGGNLSNIHCVQVACGSSHTMILSDMVRVAKSIQTITYC